MKIEINISKEILEDMIMEQEMKNSSCFIGDSSPIDEISQEFLVTLIELRLKVNISKINMAPNHPLYIV